MKRTIGDLTFATCACAAISCTAHGASAPSAPSPEIHIEDVEHYYQIYDAANGRPTAGQLQRVCIDVGYEGLHTLARLRNITGARIAETLDKNCRYRLPRQRGTVYDPTDTVAQAQGWNPFS